jgi:HAD superfamily hydrolase (TIGR01509 family)
MAAYDAVLFDFDGVLIDSEPLQYACWMEVLREFRIEVTLDQYLERWVGVADSLMLEDLARLAHPPVDAATLARFHPAKKELYRWRSLIAPAWAPGLGGFLASLAGYKLAVVTSSGRGEVAPLLEAGGIRGFFGAEIYGNETPRLKPAPDPYLRAAEALGARRPLVVEDSDAGVASARAAGFDFVRVRAPGEVAAAVRERLGRGEA